MPQIVFQKIKNMWRNTAQEYRTRYIGTPDDDETFAVFREFNEKGLNTIDEFLKQTVSEKNHDLKKLEREKQKNGTSTITPSSLTETAFEIIFR